MSDNYQDFLHSKRLASASTGLAVTSDEINPALFPFQRDIVRWALKLGRAALFEECGLGKTPQQLEWARLVSQHTGGQVLILAPLAVSAQTIREGAKFGIEVKRAADQSEVGNAPIVVTNYERLHLFDTSQFVGVVLDESSILKSFTGKVKQALLAAFRDTLYKLACTATPAPNDYLELGNHADFLNVMPSNEMIMRWFINDSMEAGNYRLKGHAVKDFWRWMTSWAVCIGKPGDLGPQYDMPDFQLPELILHEHLLSASDATLQRTFQEGKLIPDDAPSSTTLHKVKRESLVDRVEYARQLVAETSGPCLVWCDTNYEADALIKVLPDAVEVRGNHSLAVKETRLTDFGEQRVRLLITKPDIAGFGLNYQHCADMVFVGVSFSFEKFYQTVRRSWRFGQTQPVNAHLIYAETEGNVRATLQTKQELFNQMQAEATEAMHDHGLFRDNSRAVLTVPTENVTAGRDWTLYQGDCVTVASQLPDNSVDFGIHSPPFANLYIYSDSEADMGNSANDGEFFAHYEYLIREMYRITRPGRLCAVHCKDLPAYMNRDGAAGLRDFPGQIIAAFERCGWQYHSRVTIWKDPVIEMQRTKNHGLLHKNFTERAEACRQGMPDYLVVFRKWPIEGGQSIQQRRVVGDYIGTNPPTDAEIEPLKRSREENYSIALWQRYASPVWFDIDQTNVLNYEQAKSDQDEKHICPLQLDVIARSIDIWSAKGDVVFSPFAGIGSEGYQALLQDRKFVGIELKPEYCKVAIKNLKAAERSKDQLDMFADQELETIAK